MNFPLPPIPLKAHFIQEKFNEIAPVYDRFNDIMTLGLHRRWKRKTALACIPSSQKKGNLIFDLCTGSGDIAFFLRQFLEEGSKIVAIDFSSGMLERFNSRLMNKGVKIQTVETDISNLQFVADQSVDGVTMGFGLRNVANREQCLKEIHRILKPGGIFANLDTGHLESRILRPLYRLYFEKFVPWMIGSVIQKSAREIYRYLPESVKAYPDQKTLQKEMEAIGFTDIQYTHFLFGAAVLHKAIKR